MTERAFIDTGALLALAGSRDQYHTMAREIAERHLALGGAWVGTTLVLAEFHGLLVRRASPAVARQTLWALLDDPAYDWIDATADLVAAGVGSWLNRYHDQDFTLTDAVSFEVMRREKLRRAFAFDAHFTTAGFELLS